ncbi:polysaccharide biosynthesis protein [Aquibacillus sp. 3ASR75-11]|uniref:Polysaccharide biosynthesis protein n=1 Tax=Terrihalobacillus insolitus TaxID=2950438 RepID=A0A9X3WXJ7_9BACI|nr:polysaccharide biosynthesis protein [Terrihalobacillus insolitus]MDC3415094.1 polysaccharide biosynthesis protein [Terrihalobacillus insolitus]MDC3426091.1 polysaccharide biosynthesis protein [Terrihalobacillus insolitus]
MSNIIRGTMLLTAATFFSKFLGMIYTIPFNELVGSSGGALYGYAYGPYNILISLSTIGVPLAVSKFVSKYNSLGDYETGRRMFKAGIGLMAMTGIIAFLLLFFGADLLARVYVVDDEYGNSASDIALVLKMVSFALLIIPSMSIIRGFFQGYESMGPTAISQIIEQIVRIIFLLTAAFFVLNVFNGTIRTAVGFATFAAFVGAIGSYIVLGFYWKKRKPHLDKLIAQQTTTYDIPMQKLYKELFRYAGPFVLVGLATPLYQQVDLLTFNRAMVAIGQAEISDIAFSNINFYGHKLVIIPVTLATGLSLTILPAITKSITDNNKTLAFKQINQALQIVMLLVLPAVVGMSLLSNEVYGSFYGMENIGINGPLLAWYAPVGLFFAFFTVTSSILQGINEQRFAVISLTAGLIVKITLNIPLMYAFGAKGAVIGTMLAVFIAVILNFWRIKTSIQFSYREFKKRSALVAILTTIMAITVWITRWILGLFLSNQDGRMETVFILVITMVIGAVMYVWLCYESTLLERTIGSRVRVLEKLFRRR